MSITYADKPLLLEDPDGELAQWIDHYLPLCDAHDWGRHASIASARHNQVAWGGNSAGISPDNYGPLPAPRINTLYWPTGAIRWSFGYFLCDEEDTLAALRSATSNGTAPATLVIGDGIASVDPSMYLLPPRPLTWKQKTGLYLLPLVDERYWWQYRHLGPVSWKEAGTWAEFYDEIESRLDIEVEDRGSISANYFKPSEVELGRQFANAALVLDATARSTGRRIVRSTDGTVTAQTWDSAEKSLNGNMESAESMIAGGWIASPSIPTAVPDECTVTFPRWYYYAVWPDEYKQSITKSASGNTTHQGVSGTTKIIHSSAFADFSLEDTAPDNETDLSGLAGAIAAAFYASIKYRYDFCFSGVKNWLPNGYDDVIEWTIGRRNADGSYAAQTRVRSLPANFGPEEQCQQFDDLFVVAPLAKGVLLDELEHDGTAMVELRAPDDNGDEQNLGIEVKVHPWMLPNSTKLDVGLSVEIAFMRSKLRDDMHHWYITAASECRVPEQ